ncbi:MAG: hypothetical protein GY952_20910 [Rhodobacteraceae bacterium]|nr:hypothetical protein [Paracoccaceae bacterium]
MHVFALRTLTIAALLLQASIAAAQDFAIQGVASLEILPGYRTAHGTHMAAARIRLKDGWKTYWRAPGDNGIPPRFQWAGSQNIAGVAIHWPAPHIFVQDGITTIGYSNQLVLPLEFQPKEKGGPISLTGSIDFGVCKDVCLPVRASFAAVLPLQNPSHKPAIRAALKSRPMSASRGGVKSVQCTITPVKDGFAITAKVRLDSEPNARALAVLEFPHPEVWLEQNKTRVTGAILTASATLYPFTKQPLVLDRSKFRLTVLDKSRTIEIRGCPA